MPCPLGTRSGKTHVPRPIGSFGVIGYVQHPVLVEVPQEIEDQLDGQDAQHCDRCCVEETADKATDESCDPHRHRSQDRLAQLFFPWRRFVLAPTQEVRVEGQSVGRKEHQSGPPVVPRGEIIVPLGALHLVVEQAAGDEAEYVDDRKVHQDKKGYVEQGGPAADDDELDDVPEADDHHLDPVDHQDRADRLPFDQQIDDRHDIGDDQKYRGDIVAEETGQLAHDIREVGSDDTPSHAIIAALLVCGCHPSIVATGQGILVENGNQNFLLA